MLTHTNIYYIIYIVHLWHYPIPLYSLSSMPRRCLMIGPGSSFKVFGTTIFRGVGWGCESSFSFDLSSALLYCIYFLELLDSEASSCSLAPWVVSPLLPYHDCRQCGQLSCNSLQLLQRRHLRGEIYFNGKRNRLNSESFIQKVMLLNLLKMQFS